VYYITRMQASASFLLKSGVSKPLENFDPAAEAAQALSWIPQNGANVSPRRWCCSKIARACRRVCLPVVSFVTRRFINIAVEDLDHLDGLPGPVIFAASHESKLDALVLLAALPARFRYRLAIAMGDWIFWEGWFGGRVVQRLRYDLLVLASNIFTIPPNAALLRPAVRHIEFLLAKGCSLLIFPEGMHSPWLLPFQAGVGWIAQHTGAPIVPVYIHGMGAVFPRDARRIRTGSVLVRFGLPILPEGQDFRALTTQIEQEVHRLRAKNNLEIRKSVQQG
jgi:1-acyl-sn-glycerol-3-phosphate acyltransferase